MPRADEPIELDDEDEPRPRRRRPADDAEYSTVGVWAIGKWAAFAGGVLCVLLALSEPAQRGAVWAGMACFCAIAARLAQAEEHNTKP